MKTLNSDTELLAIIFDMDGVIVNSEQIIAEAGVTFFRQKGINVNVKEFSPFIGTGELNYLRGVAQKHELEITIEDKQKLYNIYKEIAKEKLVIYDGVYEVIEKAKKHQIKIALATSADISKVHINFSIVDLDTNLFDLIISGNDIKNKKPHPEIFQKTCSKLNIQPCNAIVIEDSPMGISAAKDAGCKCVAITNTFAKTKLTLADLILPDLYSITKLLEI